MNTHRSFFLEVHLHGGEGRLFEAAMVGVVP